MMWLPKLAINIVQLLYKIHGALIISVKIFKLCNYNTKYLSELHCHYTCKNGGVCHTYKIGVNMLKLYACRTKFHIFPVVVSHNNY